MNHVGDLLPQGLKDFYLHNNSSFAVLLFLAVLAVFVYILFRGDRIYARTTEGQRIVMQVLIVLFFVAAFLLGIFMTDVAHAAGR